MIVVLVAHNGFSFDYPILMSEVESREDLSLSLFYSNDVHFSDSLPLLRAVIQETQKNLNNH